MKKNFDKTDHKDDRLMIDLLKKVDLEEPSEQFVDNTLKAFLNKRNPIAFQAIKAPKIMIAVLSFLLFLPFLIVEWPGITPSNFIPSVSYIKSTQESKNWS